MRILFTQETDWITRNPAQQHHLAEVMSLRGHEIRVLDYDILWQNKGKKELFSKREVFEKVSKIHKDSNVTVIRPGIIKLPIMNYISLIFSHRNEINRQIKEFKPEVIVGWGILNSYLAASAANENNIPFVYYWIDVLHLLIPNRLFHPLAKIVEKKALIRADLVLTINEKLKDYVVSMGASTDRTRVIMAGIELERFNPNTYTYTFSIRKQYGLEARDRVLLFIGWLCHFSGLDDVMHALSKNSDSQLKLLVIGEGDAYNDLKVLRDRYRLGDRVILAGKKDYSEIPWLIAAADICILPADPVEPIMQDTVPIKIYEYMAMKKPVISTRLPGVMKEFGEGNGVIYVEQPKGVVKAAEGLIKSGRGYILRLGLIARKYVEKNSWDKITDEFESTLKNVIGGTIN